MSNTALPWSIGIDRNGGAVSFDPPSLEASANDEISWSNNDDRPHWPGRTADANGPVTDPTFFMAHQIAADDSSDAWRPGDADTYYYACSLHKNERGAIVVDDGS
jgi:plastocyanin